MIFVILVILFTAVILKDFHAFIMAMIILAIYDYKSEVRQANKNLELMIEANKEVAHLLKTSDSIMNKKGDYNE